MGQVGIDAQLVFNCKPDQTSFWVAAYTNGWDSVRLQLADGTTTTPQTPHSQTQTSAHQVTGLTPGTSYDYTLQGSNDSGSTWSDLATGTNATMRAPGGPDVFRVGVLMCTFSNADKDAPWNQAMSHDLDWWWHGGDWHYDNKVSDSKIVHLSNLIQQAVNVAGLRNMAKSVWFYYNPSDHEFTENNGQTGGQSTTLAFQAAWRSLFPMYDNGLKTDGALCWSFNQGNDIEHIIIDFRNYYRTDSDDPNIPWDDPRRKALSDEQLSWLIDKINEKHRFTFIYSDPVWLSNIVDGKEEELHNKTDAWASYGYQRGLIAQAMVNNPAGVMVTGDYHCLSVCNAENNPHGGWLLLGAASTCGNMTYRGGNYDQYFPAEDSDPDTPTSQWGEIITTDDVDTITVAFTGWDNTDPDNPVAQVQTTVQYKVQSTGGQHLNGGVPVAPDGSPPGSLMTGTPGAVQFGDMLMGDYSVIGWRGLSGWRDMPAVDLTDAPWPSGHGEQVGDLFAQGVTVTFDGLLNAAQIDLPAAVAAFEANTPVSPIERALVVDDGDGPKLRWARTVARTVQQDKTFGIGAVPLSVQWRCADPRRYALDNTTVQVGVGTPGEALEYPLTYPLDYGGSVIQSEPFTAGGSVETAPVITIRGSITDPSVNTENWSLKFRGTVGVGSVLIVDVKQGTVTLNGVDWTGQVTDDSTPIDACVLTPGLQDTLSLSYSTVGTAHNATVELAWRDAWI